MGCRSFSSIHHLTFFVPLRIVARLPESCIFPPMITSMYYQLIAKISVQTSKCSDSTCWSYPPLSFTGLSHLWPPFKPWCILFQVGIRNFIPSLLTWNKWFVKNKSQGKLTHVLIAALHVFGASTFCIHVREIRNDGEQLTFPWGCMSRKRICWQGAGERFRCVSV